MQDVVAASYARPVMAARRLLIVMLILLGISTLAAALAPTPNRSGTAARSTATTTREPPEVPEGGKLVRATIDADARPPETVEVPLGDQLALQVRSRRPGEIEILGLGLIEDVARLAPARFDILARRPGRFELRRVDSRERVGVLMVR